MFHFLNIAHDENITATTGPHWVWCHWDGCPQFNATDWCAQIWTAPLTSPRPVFVQQLKGATSNTLTSCIHLIWLGTALSPTNYILLSCRKLICINIIVVSGKCIWIQNFNSVFTWIFTQVMKTCEQGALSRGAEWAHARHQQAAPLPYQWCVKLWPGGCNRYIHHMPAKWLLGTISSLWNQTLRKEI